MSVYSYILISPLASLIESKRKNFSLNKGGSLESGNRDTRALKACGWRKTVTVPLPQVARMSQADTSHRLPSSSPAQPCILRFRGCGMVRTACCRFRWCVGVCPVWSPWWDSCAWFVLFVWLGFGVGGLRRDWGLDVASSKCEGSGLRYRGWRMVNKQGSCFLGMNP